MMPRVELETNIQGISENIKLRRTFIKDPSLVLYLPLYQLRGTSFKSQDAYAHSCTVTGAVWTPHGRDFSGTDQYINCGSGAKLDNIAIKTVEAWIKLDSFGEGPAGRIVQKALVNAAGWQLLVQGGVGMNRLYFMQSWDGSVADWVTPTDSLTLATWYHVVTTYNRGSTGNNPLMYINRVSQNVTNQNAPLGAVDSDAGENLWIGSRNNEGTPDREFDGLVGEVRVYDRGLSASEILNNYLATKWRYK